MWRVYRRTRKEEDYAKYKEALKSDNLKEAMSKNWHVT